MQHDNTKAYANIKPISHPMGRMRRMMRERYSSELTLIETVNSLAGDTEDSVRKRFAFWQTMKKGTIYVSLVPLLVTMLIYFISPMLTQTEFANDDVRVWGMGLLFSTVGFVLAVIIDVGRANILDTRSSTGMAWVLYIFLSILSVLMSTTGMLAVASFYASGDNNTATDTKIREAKDYTMANAAYAGMTMADLDKKAQDNEYQYKTISGGGYPTSTYNRIRKEVATEKMELKKYLNAQALVDNKGAAKGSDESSNWLFNTYSTILESSIATAALAIGLILNLASEIVALWGHLTLRRLSARIEIVENIWSNAQTAADKALMMGGGRLVPVDEFGTFVYSVSIPVHLMNSYRNNTSLASNPAQVPSGVAAPAPMQQTVPADPVLTDQSASGQSAEQQAASSRYKVAATSKAGDVIECPACSTAFKKKNARHTYCTNKGKGNCSDEYKNLMNPKRIRHAKQA